MLQPRIMVVQSGPTTFSSTPVRRLNIVHNKYDKLAKMNLNTGKRRSSFMERLTSNSAANILLITMFTILWCSTVTLAQNTGMYLPFISDFSIFLFVYLFFFYPLSQLMLSFMVWEITHYIAWHMRAYFIKLTIWWTGNQIEFVEWCAFEIQQQQQQIYWLATFWTCFTRIIEQN